MIEVIDALGNTEAIPAAPAVPDFLVERTDELRWITPARHRVDVLVSGRWSSTLCQRDLQCLLLVLETDLIPQLLNGYSPAASTPLPSPEGLG